MWRPATRKGIGTRRITLVFTAAALVTLVAGVCIERNSEELFGRWGMSGVLFGATVLAAATSLPELSTGLTSPTPSPSWRSISSASSAWHSFRPDPVF
ncbi:hypothetical protein ACIBCN_28495 [Nocardia sp. NPDC051052]|uniref:hypothetical protein n=1 Tax=Nocardia sp. NPDC051052 TaxID=3364322 RepID=UPI0037B6DA17